MALYKIGDRYPNYRDIYFDGGDLKEMRVYSAENMPVGEVQEMLVNEEGRLKYLVVNLHGQKQVLLPARSCARTTQPGSLYVRDLDSEDISLLATYDKHTASTDTNSPVPADYPMASLESSAPVEASMPVATTAAVRNTARLSELEVRQPQEETPDTAPISLYEERLVVHKHRQKTGEVKISKRIVTDTANASVPVKKEKIVIEIESIYGGDTQVQFEDAKVSEDGSIHMDIYEERAEICRQVVPYQNVSVRKEVVEDVVTTTEMLRREELDVEPKEETSAPHPTK